MGEGSQDKRYVLFFMFVHLFVHLFTDVKSGRTLKMFIFSHEENKRFLLFLCAFFHVNKMNGAVMSISSSSCVLIASGLLDMVRAVIMPAHVGQHHIAYLS